MIFHITDNNYKTVQKEIATFCKEQSLSAKAHMTLTSAILETYVEKGREPVQLKDVLKCIEKRYEHASAENSKEHYEYMMFKLERAVQKLSTQTK